MNSITVSRPGSKPYLNTGYKMYIIGGQDGLFPEKGEHLPYEMWGLWMPPIKVLQGFWFLIDGSLVRDAEQYEQLPYGSRFFFRKEGEWGLERFQFIPQDEKGMVVELTLRNLSEEKKAYTLQLGLRSHMRPVWLAERAGIQDGADHFTYQQEKGRLILTDGENPWEARLAASAAMTPEEDAEAPVACRENEKCAYFQLKTRVTLEKGEEKKLRFWLAASEQSGAEAERTLERLMANTDALLQEKMAVYERLDATAVLSFPGKPQFAEMYRWTKYINDWIIRKVSGIGTGIVAGYAEFPWWFGNDTNYIVPAMLMQGSYEVCKETLRLLRRKSEEYNGNGRVVHEISNNGVVYYEGMTTETPQFADTVWNVYQWSGDREFLEEMYDFCRQGMDWIEESCVDGLPRGYGISEIAGLDCFCCDTALLAIRGFEILANMSQELGKSQAAAAYREKQERSWNRFQKEFYMPEYGFYGDMVATKEEIIPRAETWKYTLKSFPITDEEKIMGESSCKHDKSPTDTAAKEKLRARMEGVIEQAGRLPDGARRAYYLFGFGHSFIPVQFGYIKGREAEEIRRAQLETAEREYIAVENMMPIGLGREIVGLGNMQKLPELLENIQRVAEGFSRVMPGATNEIYPEMGCFVQAWNSMATMWPYANSIFGIKPNAGKKTISLQPCVGPQVDGIALTNLPIGGESFDFSYRQTETGGVLTVRRPSPEWTVQLDDSAEGLKLVLE